MAFGKKKIIFSILGATIATGFAVVSNNYPNNNKTAPQKPQETKTLIKAKLRTKYKGSLIDEGNFWRSRFEELQKGDPKHKDLQVAQKLDISNGLDKLKKTCEEISDQDENSEVFEDFQKFCTMKNKDGVTSINSKNGFTSKYSIFANTNRNDLSQGFAEIWDRKDKSSTEDWKQAMLDECKKLQEKMYVDDLADKNFTTYCTK